MFRGALAGTLAVAAFASAPRLALALDPDRPLGACTVERWSARHGLPGSMVRAFAQTPDGYLWVAAYGGVARYDGARLVTLPDHASPARIFDTQTLKVDAGGTLWVISSLGDPVCVREGVPRDCLPAAGLLPTGTRLADAHPDGDGTVWLAGRAGLFRFLPGAPAQVVPVALPATGRIWFVHRDRRGRLWLGAEQGLYRQGGDGAFTPVSTPDGAVTGRPRALFETPQGRLWFAIDRRLLRAEEEGMHELVLPGPEANISAVIEDRDGNLWVGTGSGLRRHRDGRWVTFTVSDGLPEDAVTALLEDREGSLWVGTQGGGIAQFTDRVVATGAGPPTLRNERVETVAQDRSGAYWVGWRQGLLRWKDGEERLFGPRDGLPHPHVLAVSPGAGDEIWVGTREGLARLRNGRIDSPLRIQQEVAALYLDDAGSLWIGQLSRLRRLHQGRLEDVARSTVGNIRSIQPDGAGVVWVAGYDGVARLERGQLVPVPLSPTARRPRALHRDRDGRLWLTAGSELVSLSPGPVRVYGAEGVPGALQLFQVIDDDRGHLWVGSTRGLLRLPKRQLVAIAGGQRARLDPVSLDTSDRRRDVVATKTRQPSAWRDRAGRLWFGAEQGLLMVEPARLRLNEHPPTIRIDEASADGRTIVRGQRNELPPGPGNLEFRFSAVTLIEPHKSQHRYLLEGFEESWVEAGSRRVAYYTNIPPGRYRFRVQGSNADGVWNEEGDALELRLGTHFYRTGWFYAALALAALATVMLLWRQRVQSLRREYLAAFGERSRVARELHDTLLQGMSGVALRLRGVRRRLGPEAPAVAREIADIDQLVTTALEETRMFLGELRGPSGPGDLAVALERLAGRLTEGREVAVAVTVEGIPVALPDGVKGDLFRSAQEAIVNALKHASPTRIEVKLVHRAQEVSLMVTDDGCGFDQASAAGAADSHFGLLGMRERGARLGEFRLSSAPGQGTTVEVTARLGSRVERRYGRA